MNNNVIKTKIEILNDLTLEKVSKYLNLKVTDNLSICCPYYIDLSSGFIIDLMRKSEISEEKINNFYQRYKNNEIDFGWFSGKGSPEEIELATKNILSKNLENKPITKEGVIQFMKLHGLGIDCSGLVYQSLFSAFNYIGVAKEFNESLNWADVNKQGVRRANVKVFVDNASFEIEPNEIRPLDLIVQKRHVAIILKKDDQFMVAQSTPWNLNRDGVNISKFLVVENKPIFDFKPTMGDIWEDSYKKDELKFMRLNILK